MEAAAPFSVLYAVKISYIERKGKRKRNERQWKKRAEKKALTKFFYV